MSCFSEYGHPFHINRWRRRQVSRSLKHSIVFISNACTPHGETSLWYTGYAPLLKGNLVQNQNKFKNLNSRGYSLVLHLLHYHADWFCIHFSFLALMFRCGLIAHITSALMFSPLNVWSISRRCWRMDQGLWPIHEVTASWSLSTVYGCDVKPLIIGYLKRSKPWNTTLLRIE